MELTITVCPIVLPVIVFIDNEHELAYEKPWGEKILAARTRIKYRLEDMANDVCLIVRYTHATPELLREVGARAVFISGNSASADDYDPDDQVGLRRVIDTREWPMFGFCGGFQVMAETYGAPLEPIGVLGEGEEENAVEFAPGMKAEVGYHPIELVEDHALLAELGSAPVMRHAHAWEIKSLPDGFVNVASTEMSPIQMMVHQELPIVGTQFHPEYYTDDHPAGGRLIANFMSWAGIV